LGDFHFTKGFYCFNIIQCSLDDIGLAFGKSNPSNRRAILWSKCLNYIGWVKTFNVFSEIYIDGSFTTGKHEPGDIDLVIYSSLNLNSLKQVIQSNHDILKAVSESYTKPTFEVHPFLSYSDVQKGSPQDLVDFFQKLRTVEAQKLGLPASARKGILKVTL
jgi:hypothetical protein